MRWFSAFLAAFLIMIAASAGADAISDCIHAVDAQRRVQACTTTIASGRLDTRNLAIAYLNRGTAYQLLEDNPRAIADFTRSIDLNPNDARPYNNRGIVLAIQMDYQSAISDLDRAIAIDPEYAGAYNNRGRIYRLLGQYDRAREDLVKALLIDPDFSAARKALGELANQPSAGRSEAIPQPPSRGELPTGSERPALPDTRRYEVTGVPPSDVLNVRSGPGTRYRIVGVLVNGTTVHELECQWVGSSRWCKIEVPSGMRGWANAHFLTAVNAANRPSPPSAPEGAGRMVQVTGVQANDFLNVRSGPGTGYRVVDLLANGTTIHELECQWVGSSRWCRIEMPSGDRGWVNARFLKPLIATD